MSNLAFPGFKLQRMKLFYTLLFVICACAALDASAQRNLSEGSLTYNISIETGSSQPKMADMFDGATTTVYLKGNESRTEMVSGLGSEATIYNATTGSGVILKDYSAQKLMITLTPAEWKANNKKYEGIVFENTGETAEIAGFTCKKAIAKLKDSSTFIVYYTTDINIANKDYDSQFKNLPGLAVQYEMETGKMKEKFTLAKINYSVIPASKFEIPKSGYRVLTYEEAKKLSSKSSL
jgi:GLPGLI family protein